MDTHPIIFTKNPVPLSRGSVQINEVEFDESDSIVGFGYKAQWIAVPTDNRLRIAEILGLHELTETKWVKAIEQAYEGGVSISPEVDGWTLITGWGFPSADSQNGITQVKGILQNLSLEFGSAQYFATHRVVEFQSWIHYENGELSRSYSYLGESGETIDSSGSPKGIEKTLNLFDSSHAHSDEYYEQEDLVIPDEELVLNIAADWSINPSTLEERSDIPGKCLLANIK